MTIGEQRLLAEDSFATIASVIGLSNRIMSGEDMIRRVFPPLLIQRLIMKHNSPDYMHREILERNLARNAIMKWTTLLLLTLFVESHIRGMDWSAVPAAYYMGRRTTVQRTTC